MRIYTPLKQDTISWNHIRIYKVIKDYIKNVVVFKILFSSLEKFSLE